MRGRSIRMLLAGAAIAAVPAVALAQSGGAGADMDFWYNLIGLVGLLGLRGLWRPSDNDGYTSDPV